MSNNDVNIDARIIEEQRKKLVESKERPTRHRIEFDERNYLTLRLNPGEKQRKVKIRILPVSGTELTPFLVLHTHSMKVSQDISKSGYKSYICLNEPRLDSHDSRGCPLCKKSEELIAQSNSLPNDNTHKDERKALFKQAMQFKSKETFIVRVIERGKEDEGVKFWRFNAHNDSTGIYDQLMSIYDNRMEESVESGNAYYKIVDEVEGIYTNVDKSTYDSLPEDKRKIIPYNVFDLLKGRDFVITLEYVESTGKTTIKVDAAGYDSPLSNDTELIRKWVYDEKTWSDLYSLKPYEYLDMIAEGKVPVFDKEQQKYVEKKAFSEDVVDKSKIIEVARAELKKLPTVSDDTDDNLPF
ncbi:MAG: hypothetical protein J6Y37_07595 [Paludibacteraceae bacterium]|nr:hypothetical protein [Paludibacteraceae bacterium]